MTEIINLGPVSGISNIVIPKMGPAVLACKLNFADTTTIEAFTFLSIALGQIEYVQGAYIDNSQNDAQLHLRVNSTQQNIVIPARAQGYVSILFTQVPDLVVTTVQADVDVTFHFYNVPIQANIWLTDDTAPGGAGLTDAELRASPIQVVSGGSAYADQSIPALSGASETLLPANANRTVLFIVNVGVATIWINLVGDPATAGGAAMVPILAGGNLLMDSSVTTSEVTVIGTAGEPVTAYEG